MRHDRSGTAEPRNTTHRTLGPAIRALRELQGIPHGVFAVECDTVPSHLTRIEQGIKQPSPALAQRMANRLGVPLEAIRYEAPACSCKKAAA